MCTRTTTLKVYFLKINENEFRKKLFKTNLDDQISITCQTNVKTSVFFPAIRICNLWLGLFSKIRSYFGLLSIYTQYVRLSTQITYNDLYCISS